jgi:pyridoxamine 5'-phosphate oxidase
MRSNKPDSITDGDPLSEPLEMFSSWYAAARAASPLKHPGAVCVSTVNEQGVPEGRFVDFKLLSEDGFVFGTHLHSSKARALTSNSNVAMTFWWDHMERQVRIVGRAGRLSREAEDSLFANRSRDAQIASWASKQSAPLNDAGQLDRELDVARQRFAGVDIPRPDHWGGYCVVPTRIEFLEFRANRLHERVLFERNAQGWQRSMLQP